MGAGHEAIRGGGMEHMEDNWRTGDTVIVQPEKKRGRKAADNGNMVEEVTSDGDAESSADATSGQN